MTVVRVDIVVFVARVEGFIQFCICCKLVSHHVCLFIYSERAISGSQNHDQSNVYNIICNNTINVICSSFVFLHVRVTRVRFCDRILQ